MFMVPDQMAPMPFVPPPPPPIANMAAMPAQVFVVPSDMSSISDISSSAAYDLQRVRDQYAMGSNSSLAYSDHESMRSGSRRHGRIMHAPEEPGQGPPRGEWFNNGSGVPLIPSWGSTDVNRASLYPNPTGNQVLQVPSSSEPEPKKEGTRFFGSMKTLFSVSPLCFQVLIPDVYRALAWWP